MLKRTKKRRKNYSLRSKKRALEQSRGVKWRKEGDLEWDSMRGMEDSSLKRSSRGLRRLEQDMTNEGQSK